MKKLYCVEIAVMVMAENEEDALEAIEDEVMGMIDVIECGNAHEAKTVPATWANEIPFNADDDEKCIDILKRRLANSGTPVDDPSIPPIRLMTTCRRCTLIFDAPPREIGRSQIDPTICILCEDPTMQTNTHTKSIKVHTIVIDDTEILHYMDHTDEWIEILGSLLVSKPTDDGDKPAAKRAPKKSKRVSATTPCDFCGREISTRQIRRHQDKCPERPSIAGGVFNIPDLEVAQ